MHGKARFPMASRALNLEFIDRREITGVVLAGGEGRRMSGQDKGLIELAGRPMFTHVVERLRPQVGALMINANRNADRYAASGYTVAADAGSEFQGPLAGFVTALTAARTPWVVVVPCDSPFVPSNLVSRLADAIVSRQAEAAVVVLEERPQPVFAMLHTGLLDSVRGYLAAGERKVDPWLRSHQACRVDFTADSEAFRNVNTPADLAEAEGRMTRTGSASGSNAAD